MNSFVLPCPCVVAQSPNLGIRRAKAAADRHMVCLGHSIAEMIAVVGIDIARVLSFQVLHHPLVCVRESCTYAARIEVSQKLQGLEHNEVDIDPQDTVWQSAKRATTELRNEMIIAFWRKRFESEKEVLVGAKRSERGGSPLLQRAE